MVDAVDRLGGWLLDSGIAASAWLCLVMLAMIACRQPIRRRDLARVGIVGALAVVPLSAATTDRIAIRLDGIGIEGVIATGVVDRAAGLLPEGAGRLMTIGYLAVASAGIGWSLLGTWAMRRLVLSASPASRETSRLYERLPYEGRGGRPALGVSDRLRRPVLVGGRRPTIVIPTDWDRADPGAVERLRLGLLHELAHAGSRDPVFHWLAGLVQAAWFVIPPAWWLRHQLRVDQEILADDRAARWFGASSSSYAASLVDTAAGQAIANRPGPTVAEPVSTIDPDGSPLLQRVAMLVRCPFPVESSTPALWRWGLPLLSAVVLLLVARLSVVGVWLPPEAGLAAVGPLRFELRELEVLPESGERPVRLPAPLPDRFVLELELLADPGCLGAITIAGVRLSESVGTGSETETNPEAWMRIRVVKDGPVARVWIDDRPESGGVDPASDSQWLTVFPTPGRSLRIRNLTLVSVAQEEGPGPSTEATASRGAAEQRSETR